MSTEAKGNLSFDDCGDNPGVWIKRQCEALGISVAEVARESGIDRTTIFRWGSGSSRPYWDSMRRVRSVLDGYWSRRRETA